MRKYLIGIFVAVVIPIGLEVFIFSNGYVSNVTNDGWASFFGGYIGGMATLLAVFLTIDDNLIKYKFTKGEEHILECHKNSLEYCFLRYEIRNVGAGGAIEMTIKVNGKDYGIKWALPQNEKIDLYIWKSMGISTDYSITIDIDFWDTIMMGHYYRSEKLDIHTTNDDMQISRDPSYYVGQVLCKME